MSRTAKQHESWEEAASRRLAAKGFVLASHECVYGGVRFMVYNEQGDVVLGAIPFLYSGTHEQVDNFLIAQKL